MYQTIRIIICIGLISGYYHDNIATQKRRHFLRFQQQNQSIKERSLLSRQWDNSQSPQNFNAGLKVLSHRANNILPPRLNPNRHLIFIMVFSRDATSLHFNKTKLAIRKGNCKPAMSVLNTSPVVRRSLFSVLLDQHSRYWRLL
jgi:hypothetical protein